MMLREPWRTRLLFVSFALNLLLVPLAVSRFWDRQHPVTPGLPRTESIIDHMARTLTPEDAARLRDAMAGHLGDIDAARARMMASRGAMAQAIGLAPYDGSRVQDAMKAWQASWQNWSEALGLAMLDALPALTDQGRRQLADAGRRRPGP